jgi:hypothetical protein
MRQREAVPVMSEKPDVISELTDRPQRLVTTVRHVSLFPNKIRY